MTTMAGQSAGARRGAKRGFKGLGTGEFTFEGREATVEDQFEIAKLSLGKGDGGKSLGLSRELIVSGSVSCEKILEDAAVRWVGHCIMCLL